MEPWQIRRRSREQYSRKKEQHAERMASLIDMGQMRNGPTICDEKVLPDLEVYGMS